MKIIKEFTLYGFYIGILYGLGTIIYAFFKIPSMPGLYEVGIQFLITLLHGAFGALSGFLVGIIFVGFKRVKERIKKEGPSRVEIRCAQP